jgi:GNAT superfamily N-acetyltransferase
VVPAGGSRQARLVGIRIEPFGWASELPHDDLVQVAAIHDHAWAEWNPAERPMTPGAFVDADRFTHPPEVMERRLVRDGTGAVLGFGWAEWRGGTEGIAMARLFVDPAHRGRGVGRALGRELAEVARAGGRTGVTVQAAEGSPLAGMLERAGFRADMLVEQNWAQVDEASADLLAAWVAQGEAAEGYSLIAYDTRCPDALAGAFIDARHVMNDAPRFEGAPEEAYSVDELRQAEDAVAAAHFEWWTVGVRHDATGEVVGLSELYLPTARPWMVFQGDTGVAAAHRGHRLGAWMKAVNHLRLRSERPAVEVIQTWNASANEPMLRINRALGFRPALRLRAWHLPFA